MKLPQRLKSDFAYAKNLVEAGFDGAASVRKNATRQNSSTSGRHTRSVWASAAIGVAIGIGSAWLARERKSRVGMLLGGVVGGSLGYGGVQAWNSRSRTAAIAGGAIRNVNALRDARWLQKNPIAYA